VAVTAEVIRVYLDELTAEAAAQGLNPDVLLLGCTHYPLLRPLLEAAVPSTIRVIDSAQAVAETAIHILNGRLAPVGKKILLSPPDAQLRFFATDSVEKFERLGSRFLGRPVGKVQLVDLGG
jgi:glutamate racemase